MVLVCQVYLMSSLHSLLILVVSSLIASILEANGEWSSENHGKSMNICLLGILKGQFEALTPKIEIMLMSEKAEKMEARVSSTLALPSYLYTRNDTTYMNKVNVNMVIKPSPLNMAEQKTCSPAQRQAKLALKLAAQNNLLETA